MHCKGALMGVFIVSDIMSNEEIAKELTTKILDCVSNQLTKEEISKYVCDTYIEIFKTLENKYKLIKD